MKRRITRATLTAGHFLTILIPAVLLLTACGGMKERNEKRAAAKTFAEAQFSTAKKDVALMERVCGLRQLRVFGFNEVKVRLTRETPDICVTRVPFWCEGIGDNGEVSGKRFEMVSAVKVQGEGSCTLEQGPEWKDIGRLTFLRQFLVWSAITAAGVWLAWVYGAWLIQWVIVLTNGHEGTARVVVSLPLLIASGYAAAVCFGSWMAVVVCVVMIGPTCVLLTSQRLLSSKAVEQWGFPVVVAISVALLGAGGWLLFAFVPYASRGTVGWFSWLFGHF